VTLAGGTIPAGGTCTVTVDVTAASAGSYINSLAVGALSTSNGSNAGPAVATLTVNTPVTAPVPPTVSKAFNQATINAGGTSTLTITLSNADGADATGADLTDTLPSGVVVSSPPSATNNCGGTFAPAAGDSAVTLAGGTILATSSCVLTVDVTAASANSYFNSIAAGALVTINGSNAAPAIATLTVITPTTGAVPPTVSKTFSPATTSAPGSSLLTITLSNAGTVDDTVTQLTDTLPSGLAASGASTTCTGGTASNTTSTVTLTGGTIPAGGSCDLTVNVTAAVAGNYFNSLAAGALTSNNGSNAAPAIATLTINAPTILPTVGKAFSPATIGAGGISTLTITLTNSNNTAASITAPLTDTLPIGLVVSGSPNNTCGGTATTNTSPTTGISTVTLTGGSIPAAGSCVVTVNVTAAVAGSYFNSLAAGALVTSNGISAGVSIATLTVSANASVSVSKSFSPTTIKPGGVAILTITLTNSNNTVANLTVPLIDKLPKGLVIAGKGSTNCGGKYSGNKGGTKVIVIGGSIPANSSRTVTVYVTAAYAGSYINTIPIGALQTNLGSNTTAAVATLTVGKEKPTPTPICTPKPRPTPKPTYTPKPTPTYTPKPKPTYTPKPTPVYTPKPRPTYLPTPTPIY
jgi:uncharacterized repeat protein (TIGR01451 family)